MVKAKDGVKGGRLSRREAISAAGKALAGAALLGLPARGLPAAGGSGSGPGSPFRAIPYYSELSDLDAGAACARMILSAFEPKEHFPLADVCEMIFRRPGRWVFEAQLIPILEQKGLTAKLQASTPYALLAAAFEPGGRGRTLEPETRQMMAERYGPSAVSGVDLEAVAWAARHLNEKNFIPGEARFSDALAAGSEGDLVMVSVERSVLRAAGPLPYCRYNVILTGRSGDRVYYHDPGRGPHCLAGVELLERAFTGPGTDRAVLRVRRK